MVLPGWERLRGFLRQIGGAQPLPGAGKAFVDDVGRRADDFACFCRAEALHDAQQQAGDIGRRQAGKGGPQCLALRDGFLKGQRSRVAVWLAFVACLQRFPANQPLPTQQLDGAMIGRLKEPAADGLRLALGSEGRLLLAGRAPGVVKGILGQIAGLFRIGDQPAEKPKERALMPVDQRREIQRRLRRRGR